MENVELENIEDRSSVRVKRFMHGWENNTKKPWDSGKSENRTNCTFRHSFQCTALFRSDPTCHRFVNLCPKMT